MSKLDFVESFQHENIFDHIGIRNTAVVYDFCVTDYVTVKIMFPEKDVEEMDENLAYPLPELNKDQLLTVERIMADLLHTPEAPRYSV